MRRSSPGRGRTRAEMRELGRGGRHLHDSPENVECNVRAGVPEMCRVVHRGTAHVPLDCGRSSAVQSWANKRAGVEGAYLAAHYSEQREPWFLSSCSTPSALSCREGHATEESVPSSSSPQPSSICLFVCERWKMRGGIQSHCRSAVGDSLLCAMLTRLSL